MDFILLGLYTVSDLYYSDFILLDFILLDFILFRLYTIQTSYFFSFIPIICYPFILVLEAIDGAKPEKEIDKCPSGKPY